MSLHSATKSMFFLTLKRFGELGRPRVVVPERAARPAATAASRRRRPSPGSATTASCSARVVGLEAVEDAAPSSRNDGMISMMPGSSASRLERVGERQHLEIEREIGLVAELDREDSSRRAGGRSARRRSSPLPSVRGGGGAASGRRRSSSTARTVSAISTRVRAVAVDADRLGLERDRACRRCVTTSPLARIAPERRATSPRSLARLLALDDEIRLVANRRGRNRPRRPRRCRASRAARGSACISTGAGQ